MPKKPRSQLRSEYADAVCREVRYQIAACGEIRDHRRLYRHLMRWYRYSKKDRWTRPKDVPDKEIL